jgi:alpha-galactosidase/6-phospho-beta-glucosidase family protein
MTTIKKIYQEVHAILSANENKKVKDILPLLEPIMEAQQRDKNHFEDQHGLWIFCYYHKEWELTKQVEYGKKANTATGLNSMCKVGTNQWTKQQREFKKFKSELLDKVASGEISADQIESEIEKLEEDKNRIVPLWESHWEEALQDPRQEGSS